MCDDGVSVWSFGGGVNFDLCVGHGVHVWVGQMWVWRVKVCVCVRACVCVCMCSSVFVSPVLNCSTW